MRGSHLLAIASAIAIASSSYAQPGRMGARRPGGGAASAEKADNGGPKPYDEVITDEFTTDAGLFRVHRNGEDVYYEIPVTELDKDMVWVTSIAGTQAGYSYAGMPVNDRVVRWEQRDDKILLRDIKYQIRADTDDPISIAVEATNIAPIIHSFDIAAFGKDKAPVIKVSGLFTTDKPEFSAKDSIDAQGLDSSRTFIEEVKSFPENIETKVLATYTPKQDNERRFEWPPPAVRKDRSQSGVTVLLHHSMVKLPENPMQPRVYDERVGFFTTAFEDYADDSEHDVNVVRYVTRWRLEKKDPSAEISEPVEPIVWYVGRGVPEKWRPYVIKGIEMWQPAFESAGFKNAIVGKIAPTEQEDPDWDAEDARITTIRWLPSDIPNAFGPNVHDPRTGEILEADVRMYHNVMKLVRDWYFVQASPSDERAQKLPMPDDLMGDLIAFVVAHEVGHSLGFPHNMKASSSYTVEQLRDPEFTSTMGTAPSIMDYARFNYVAQPEDGAATMPQVGVYDHFAVEWGYRQFDDSDTEKAELHKIVARQKDNPMLLFGDPNAGEDPTQQTEDLGADAVAATRLGVRNLERVASYLVEATCDENEDYSLLENMHGALLGQWRREMGHVANVVGGFDRRNFFYGDAEVRYHPIDAARQREAVAFLQDYAFSTAGIAMFVKPDITLRLEAAGTAENVLNTQKGVLDGLVSESRIKRMAEHAARGGDVYTPSQLMADVSTGLWSELDAYPPVTDLYRRNIQRAHLEILEERLDSDDAASDMAGLARAELAALKTRIEDALTRGADAETQAHLEESVARITFALEKIKVEQEEKPQPNARRFGR